MSSTLTPDRCVVRGTHRHKGRTLALDPRKTAAKQLHYGRITLDAGPALRFGTRGLETGLVALRGRARIETGGRHFDLAPYDALYAGKVRVGGDFEAAKAITRYLSDPALPYVSPC